MFWSPESAKHLSWDKAFSRPPWNYRTPQTAFSTTLLRSRTQLAANGLALEETSPFFSFPRGSRSPCSSCSWWEFSHLKIPVPILSHRHGLVWWSFIKAPLLEESGCSRQADGGGEHVGAVCRAVPARWASSPSWASIPQSSSKRNLTRVLWLSLHSPSQLSSCLLILFCLWVNDELWRG